MILWNDSTLCISCELSIPPPNRLLGASNVLKTTQIEWFTHPRNHQLCPLWTKQFFGGCLTQLLYHIFGTPQPTSGPGILGGASASVWPHHVVGANTQWTWAPKPRVEGISWRPIWWGTYALTSPTKWAILRHLSLWPSIFWGRWFWAAATCPKMVTPKENTIQPWRRSTEGLCVNFISVDQLTILKMVIACYSFISNPLIYIYLICIHAYIHVYNCL